MVTFMPGGGEVELERFNSNLLEGEKIRNSPG
jgi:hypothetical protein